MNRQVRSRLASFGIPYGLLLLALHGQTFAGPGPCAVCPKVPELDPGIASGGLILLAGAVLLVIEGVRRRRR